jgi:hypothetical protein
LSEIIGNRKPRVVIAVAAREDNDTELHRVISIVAQERRRAESVIPKLALAWHGWGGNDSPRPASCPLVAIAWYERSEFE